MARRAERIDVVWAWGADRSATKESGIHPDYLPAILRELRAGTDHVACTNDGILAGRLCRQGVALEHHQFDQSAGIAPPWTWCAHCQRAYLTGTSRVLHFAGDALHPRAVNLALCPYFDCGRSTARHGWRWATLRQQHPEYPVTPALDTVYVR